MCPMRVLAFGTYDTRLHPRVGVLIEGLREHGDEVREVVVPLDLDTAARVAVLRQPWRLPLLGWRLLRAWGRLSVSARAAVRSWTPDAVLVGYLGHFDVVLARLLFPRTRIVLDHLVFAADTAADRRQTGRAKRWVLGRLDRGAIASADVVVLDTAEHAALVPGPARGRAVVAPVGAGRSWFADDGGQADLTGRPTHRATDPRARPTHRRDRRRDPAGVFDCSRRRRAPGDRWSPCPLRRRTPIQVLMIAGQISEPPDCLRGSAQVRWPCPDRGPPARSPGTTCVWASSGSPRKPCG
jgi:hypothetical protein